MPRGKNLCLVPEQCQVDTRLSWGEHSIDEELLQERPALSLSLSKPPLKVAHRERSHMMTSGSGQIYMGKCSPLGIGVLILYMTLKVKACTLNLAQKQISSQHNWVRTSFIRECLFLPVNN